jgi:hypothetical protein
MLWLKSGVALWQLLPFPSHTCTVVGSMYGLRLSVTDAADVSDGPPFVTEMKYFTDLPATAWNPESGESGPVAGTADIVFVVTPRSAFRSTVAVASAEFAVEPGSAVSLVSAAPLVSCEPFDALADTVPVTVQNADAPFASELTVPSEITPPPPIVAVAQFVPLGHTSTEAGTRFESTVSFTTTFSAVDGPWFVTVTTYFSPSPATASNPLSGATGPVAGTADTVFVTPRSAFRCTVAGAAWLFEVGPGSDESVLETEARFVSVAPCGVLDLTSAVTR